MRLFKKEQALKDKLSGVLTIVKNQFSRLQLIKYKLREREKLLLEKLSHTNNKNVATVLANEISAIRKLYTNLDNILVALESFILRTETILSLDEFTKMISPIPKVLSSIREDVNKISPILAGEMEELMNSLESLRVYYPESDSFALATLEDAEVVLKEAAEAASKKVATSIPEIPLSRHDKKLSDQPMLEAEGYGTIQLSSSDSLLEDKLIRYIIEKNGKIDLKRCSEELGISQSKLNQVIEDLIKQGRIQRVK